MTSSDKGIAPTTARLRVFTAFLLGAALGAGSYACWLSQGEGLAHAAIVTPTPAPAPAPVPKAMPRPKAHAQKPTRHDVLDRLSSADATVRAKAAKQLRELTPADRALVLSSLVSKGRILYESFDAPGEAQAKTAGEVEAPGVRRCNSWKMVAGVFGTALRTRGRNLLFGASGGHVRLSNLDLTASKEFSVALWVREEAMEHSHGEYYIAFGVWPRDLRIHSMHGKVGFGMGEPKLTNFGSVIKGRFAFYCLTYSKGELRAYQNGVCKGTIPAELKLKEPKTHARLGSHFWYHGGKQASARLTAAYDDLRLYNRALTPHEIQVLYDAAGQRAQHPPAPTPTPTPRPIWPDGELF
jgi:concanavalin A-like lectin/glucanase superfamily protein